MIVRALVHNRAPLLSLRLPGLAAAALAPVFLLVFTAEIWDAGLSMSNGTATAYALISMAAATLYLTFVQRLFLPRKEVRSSKDPMVFTVLFEDSAALLGLVTALVGIYLSQALELPVLDGVASVIIGLILICTATFLAYECQGLLTGEGLAPEEAFRSILSSQGWHAAECSR